eukprot:CAMPEP_0201489094 /NCGR_PEP_ID=MMETSP0151_2-20130828/21021_1 /ASSEMBLY_ACC=CAM_ASM_000257 /TAXON_ID=200890 /ORGANISM="Paramoeba atlantica, Strain 621/1 / CCAP 1560/9" /LENGTH=303 /DNA_ID=CAMNT_0047874575 /DNA_START=79 /DNA_END=993 /DNA_ORIENTATION=-
MKEFDCLPPEMREFALKQHIFFVGSCPLNPDGKINVSPKGHKGSFGFLSAEVGAKAVQNGIGCRKIDGVDSEYDSMEPKCYFAYLDFGGSGIETVAHIRDNGRMTVMFCSFDDGPPKILRLFGRGVSVDEPGEGEKDKDLWNKMVDEIDPSGAVAKTFFARHEEGEEVKVRNLIVLEVFRVRDSCGFSVPVMPFKEERRIFPDRFESWTRDALEKRRSGHNQASMDGLPGLLRFSQDVENLSSSGPASSLPPSSSSSSSSSSTSSRSSPSPPSPSSTSLGTLCGGIAIGVVLGFGIKSLISKK